MKSDDANLQALLAKLDSPRSARQLARILGCSLPVVYKRIEKLIDLGIQIRVDEARVGKRGPKSAVYSYKRAG